MAVMRIRNVSDVTLRSSIRGGAIDLGFANERGRGENSRVGNGAGIQPTRFSLGTLGPDLIFPLEYFGELA